MKILLREGVVKKFLLLNDKTATQMAKEMGIKYSSVSKMSCHLYSPGPTVRAALKEYLSNYGYKSNDIFELVEIENDEWALL